MVGFAIYQHESAMGVDVSHHPETPSHLPPHSWSMADEQCCDSFRCIAERLSHTYICIHSPPISPPVQAATKLNNNIEHLLRVVYCARKALGVQK